MTREITQAEYEAAIPRWCGYQTIEEHLDMMLCWSLVRHVEDGKPKSRASCRGCELYRGGAVMNERHVWEAAEDDPDNCAHCDHARSHPIHCEPEEVLEPDDARADVSQRE